MQHSDTTESLSRRERERLARRREMLHAARAVFAEKGYTDATLEEIAQRAEFGKGTLYNYFEGGKEDILFAILDELHDELLELVQASFAPERRHSRSIRETIHDFLAACFAFFLERQDLFMILIKESYRFMFSENPERAAYLKQQQERIVGALVPPLEAAMQAGQLRPAPPVAVAHLLLGNIRGLQMHLCLQSQEAPCEAASFASPDAAADFLTGILLDGLLARPQPAPTLSSNNH